MGSAIYQEARSALNWPLLAYGLVAPVAAECVFLILGIVVNPGWFAVPAGPLAVVIIIYASLLYRNWPAGIRIDEATISIGAVHSLRARLRTPTVSHQTWGLFTCPLPALEGARVVTDRAEVRRLKTSPRYYTLNNRWGTARTMTHCNIGVLTSPFMRAALVLNVDPTAVTATPVRPARFYTNFKGGRFSRLLRPEMSSTWIAPTRDPESLRNALETLGYSPDGNRSDR